MAGDTDQADGFDAIVVGGVDWVGHEIGRVYAKATGRYAVYGTIERVQILFADDPVIQRAQRQRLATLACLRSEIDGALTPWRLAGPRWRLGAAARQYDGRIAAGLIEALEGNLHNARRMLTTIRAEIACERTSRAQLHYLVSTIAVAVAVLVPCLLALQGPVAFFVGDPPARMVWYAVAAGVIGAVYSVALSLRKREVTNDRRWLDHLTDAGVRICIGAIAGFVIAEFLLTGTLQLRLGGVALTDTKMGILPTTPNISFVLLAGFVAGFAERFVPDLLTSYSEAPPVPVAPATVPARSGAAVTTDAPPSATAGQRRRTGSDGRTDDVDRSSEQDPRGDADPPTEPPAAPAR